MIGKMKKRYIGNECHQFEISPINYTSMAAISCLYKGNFKQFSYHLPLHAAVTFSFCGTRFHCVESAHVPVPHPSIFFSLSLCPGESRSHNISNVNPRNTC